MADSLIAKVERRAADRARRTDNALHAPSGVAEPLDDDDISDAERALGRSLPPLLREVYQRIGNGGFGPGYGLLPLEPSPDTDDGESVIELYEALRSGDPEDPAWIWPVELVPFCDWGCAIRSCVDCRSQEGAVVTFDAGAYEIGAPMESCLARTHDSLQEWFEDWVSGVKIWELMFEPDPSRTTTGINPFTREPLSLVPNKLRRK